MKQRVVVAMSGGVDSAVAAALLKNQGFEVIGMTMCFNLPDVATKKPRCCGLEGIEDARRVAEKIGIRHYVLNMQERLNRLVIKEFCQEYARGRTPNPCVRCNQYLKFDALLTKALSLDAEFLATGHYARVDKRKKYILRRAKDRKKDQSYFLYRLTQKQLKYTLFPLGNYLKTQVRNLARKFSLPVSEKKASQEICFLPTDDYRTFLKTHLTRGITPGPIVDKIGNILGEHQGIAFYTIGQRQGLGIAKGYPLYVIKIDAQENKIILGQKEDVYAREFLIGQPHFILSRPQKRIALEAKIRYNHPQARAELMPERDSFRVRFKKPQFAITPGQSAVFYQKDTVIGGGIIEKVF